MQNTTNYNLKKPDYTDFADIKDINDNMDIIDQKLASPDGDARDEVVSFTDEDLDTGITSFGTYLSKIVSGMKLAKFIRDFKAGMQYVLHKGSLINNGTCNTAGEYALDAAYGKVLRDDIDSLNSSFQNRVKRISTATTYTINANGTVTITNLSISIPTGYALLSNFVSDTGHARVYCANIGQTATPAITLCNTSGAALTIPLKIESIMYLV